MNFIGIIPARYASTRFPGKPLVNIHGKPMIQRVYEQAKKSKLLTRVVVATDDDRIEQTVKSFGGEVVMTSSSHPSGTDRCHEAFQKLNGKNSDVVINIQGDEPYIHPEQIDLLCSCFNDAHVNIATLAMKLKSAELLFNSNTPKVVIGQNSNALYFSRQPLPFLRNFEQKDWINKHTYYKHIGIYAYKASVLGQITRLAQSPLELAESLEQLRWLENGYSIRVALTEHESHSVDSPEDINKLPKTEN